ncbi:MAG TPA: cache domain-containing protein [Spirochaetia bacterium]|nr:cache domain-containing protein [Spirochaetia bacterium]
MMRWSIQARLIASFTIAILIPSLITVAVGVKTINDQVYNLAQAQINSDLEGAKEIVRNYMDRLKDALRIHATRMIIYGALDRRDSSGLGPEMERILKAEELDVLTLTDTTGKVFYRTCNPSLTGDSQSWDPIVTHVLTERAPVSGVFIEPEQELLKESPYLAKQARMQIIQTPMAGPTDKTLETSGMMFKGAAPVFSPNGRFLGVLYGGVLVNRNYEVVDRVRKIVFKEEQYKGRDLGTATLFQDDVRVATNVRNADGTRAISTRASAEVVEEVLRRGHTWRGLAFVVNDWYIAAYEPIRDIRGAMVGMLYVGTLERPYRDNLWRTLLVFLGITMLGVALGSWFAITIARRISRPIRAMAVAAQRVAEGDYTQTVEAAEHDEIGHLAECFNKMTHELTRATQQLREWAENLESKVDQRTAELKAMQGHLIQTEKLAAIGKLAAGVAHEINNPLTGVLTNSSLLLEDIPQGDPMREELQVIVDETLRCRKIVKGLLDFARQTKPQKQIVDLNSVVEDVLNFVRNQASFRDIAIEADLQAGLPAVMADRDQMRQVVLNIVLNAAEAMPKGGSIRIFSHNDQATRQIEVTIADSGPGIPDEIKGKLFEPFFTTKKSGTGLGLAIAYGIMERHKGTIKVESQRGKGTTISLHIPTDQQDSDE